MALESADERGLALRRSPSLRGLSDALLERLARRARPHPHPEGAALTRAGRKAAGLTMLLSGEVAHVVGRGRHRDVAWRAGPGALIGRSAVAGGTEATSAVATSHVNALEWSRDALTRVLEGDEGEALAHQLRCRLSLGDRHAEVLGHLRGAAVFRGTGLQLLRAVVEGATLVPYRNGDLVMRQGDAGDTMAVVISGSVGVFVANADDASRRPVLVLHPGDCVGEIALVTGSPRTADVVALQDTELLMVERDAFESLRHDSAAFRRNVGAIAHERREAAPEDEPEIDAVLIVNDTEFDATRICTLVSRYLVDAFGDRALTIALSRGDEPNRREVVDGTPLLHASVGDGHVDLEALLREQRDVDRALVCTDARHGQGLAAHLVEQVSTVIYLTDSVDAPFPFAASTRKAVRHVTLRRGDPPAIGRRGALRLELGVVPAHLHASFEALPETTRQAIGRLARAIVQREVGVALGGGAGWAWAHLPLLWGLHERGVPIDMVSGVSFGSCVAACYASMGLEGLEKLLASRGAIAMSPLFGAYSMWPWGKLFQRILAHERFEDLPTPLFVLATDILNARAHVFRSGSISEALRASSTLPGAGPTVFDGVRYLDGCLTDNVPIHCLLEEGADFVIASNVVPRPSPAPPEAHRHGWQRALSVVSPLRRLRDAVRAFYLQAHLLGDRTTSADVQFRPDLSSFSVPDYGRAKDIIARAERDLAPTLDEAVAKYRALGRQRPDAARVPEVAATTASLARPSWRRRSAFRADGPPSTTLKIYLRGMRFFARYFRYETEGYEHIVESPASLIVGYHGRPFAWDMGILSTRMYDELGYYPPTFSARTLRNIPIMRQFDEAYGGIQEIPSDAEMAELKRERQHLAVFPGGIRECARPFWVRYRIDFAQRRGYLRLAAQHDLPIIPVVCTGVDDVYLGLNDGYAMSKRLVGHGGYTFWAAIGIGGFYPFAFPLPVKMRQHIGAPIDLKPLREAAPDEETFLEEANDLVVGTMQRMLDDLRKR